MDKKLNETSKERKLRLAQERLEITKKIIQHRHEGNTVTDTCVLFNITRPTYYTYLKQYGYTDFGRTNLSTRYSDKRGTNEQLGMSNDIVVSCIPLLLNTYKHTYKHVNSEIS
jgi:phospholipid N-methyltransferase